MKLFVQITVQKNLVVEWAIMSANYAKHVGLFLVTFGLQCIQEGFQWNRGGMFFYLSQDSPHKHKHMFVQPGATPSLSDAACENSMLLVLSSSRLSDNSTRGAQTSIQLCESSDEDT